MPNIFKSSSVITLQRLYRNIKIKIKLLNFSINFHNDYVISMIDNLNNNKTEAFILLLLNELKIIKNEMDNLIYPITIRNHKENFGYCKNINKLLIKYSNYICPNNIDLIFYLFIYSSWTNVFTEVMDIQTILFIKNFENLNSSKISISMIFIHNFDLYNCFNNSSLLSIFKLFKY